MHKSILVSVLVLSYLCIHPQGEEFTCPNPKIAPPESCVVVAQKGDSDFINFDIAFKRPPYDSEMAPEKLDSLRVWSHEMFANYDFRYNADTSKKIPDQSDSNLSWSYGTYNLRKGDAIKLINERYISRLYVKRVIVTEIRPIQSTIPSPKEKPQANIDANGRLRAKKRSNQEYHPRFKRGGK